MYTYGSVVVTWAALGLLQLGAEVELLRKRDAFSVTTSSMTIEALVVDKAMNWLETQSTTHTCFFCDCKSMLRKIQTGWIRMHWLSRWGGQDYKVTVSYSCLRMQNQCQWANLTSFAVDRAVDLADILNAYHEKFLIEDSRDDKKLRSINCLLHLGVKWGVGGHDHHSDCIRSLINQHKTETVSHCVLANMLQEISERLWTCPWCNADDISTN